MAVIQKIRSRSKFVITIIAVAMALFVLADIFSSRSLFSSSANDAGYVDGDAISYNEYDQRYSQLVSYYQVANPNIQIGDRERYLYKNNAWDLAVKERLLQEQFDKLGIKVSEEETAELAFGSNPHNIARQYMMQLGYFDPQQFQQYLNNILNPPADLPDEQRFYMLQKQNEWLIIQNEMKRSQHEDKYLSLIKKGTYIPGWLAKEDYKNKNKKAIASILFIGYNDFKDSVDVSDEEIRKYIGNHKNKYLQKEEDRFIEYASFPIIPSKSDSAATKKWITDQYEAFKNTENDSAFVMNNSETPFDIAYYPLEDLNTSVKDTLFNSDTGTIIGPYFEEGMYKLAKVADRKLIPDSVKARQISVPLSIQNQQVFVVFNTLFDSIKTKIGPEYTFDDGVKELNDTISKVFQNAGELKIDSLGWIQPSNPDQELVNALFYRGKEGDILKVFKQINPNLISINLVEVTKATPSTEAIRVGYLTKEVTPSSKTRNSIYMKANNFAAQARTPEEFKAVSEKENIEILETPYGLKVSSYNIPGVGLARKVIGWTFKDGSEAGDISPTLTLDNAYIMAHLKEIRPKGILPLELVKEEVKIEVEKQKKAEKILEKYGDILRSSSSLEEMASKIGNEAQIVDVTNLSFSVPFLNTIGSDNKIAGAVFGLNEGETSKPITGEKGIAIVKVVEVTEAPEQQTNTSTASQLQNYYSQRVSSSSVVKGLKEIAEIEDLRYKLEN